MFAAMEEERAICLVFSEADDERVATVWSNTERKDDKDVQNARDIVRHRRQLCSGRPDSTRRPCIAR